MDGFQFNVVDVPLVPGLWKALVGDVIHNTRCSLDHLAFALAESFAGQLSNAQEKAVSFPVCVTESQLDTWRGRSGALFASEVLELMRALQPFNAGDPELWGSDRDPFALWSGSHLAMLADLDNVDKHRFVGPLYYTIDTASPATFPDFGPGVSVNPMLFEGPLLPGAIAGWWRFDGDTPDHVPAELDLTTCFPLQLRIADRVQSVHPLLAFEPPPLTILLRSFIALCQRIVDAFAPALDGGVPVDVATFVRFEPLA
jgi:hypothetical protein